mgnify:CR=1 FL=1
MLIYPSHSQQPVSFSTVKAMGVHRCEDGTDRTNPTPHWHRIQTLRDVLRQNNVFRNQENIFLARNGADLTYVVNYGAHEVLPKTNSQVRLYNNLALTASTTMRMSTHLWTGIQLYIPGISGGSSLIVSKTPFDGTEADIWTVIQDHAKSTLRYISLMGHTVRHPVQTWDDLIKELFTRKVIESKYYGTVQDWLTANYDRKVCRLDLLCFLSTCVRSYAPQTQLERLYKIWGIVTTHGI